MLLLRQIVTLVYKNILIALVRRPFTTPLRALVLPVVFGWFLSYARNFFIPPATYGFGSPEPIFDLQDAFSQIHGREQVVFVDNNFKGGEIEQLITTLSHTVEASGKTPLTIENENDLLTVCKNSLQGSSNCVAAVVFYSSPSEPKGAGLPYNYTLRFDGSLGASINVDSNSNDQQLFVMPLQRMVDQTIANLNLTENGNALAQMEEYPFTNLSQEERETDIRVRYMGALINILGVAFFIGISGIQYQQVGAQATERESKMAQLVEVMMPNRRRWQPQFARLLSYHIAFDLIYIPGWVIMAIILHEGVFAQTNAGIVIVFHILAGLSLASFSLFAAAFFKKAQALGVLAPLSATGGLASERIIESCEDGRPLAAKADVYIAHDERSGNTAETCPYHRVHVKKWIRVGVREDPAEINKGRNFDIQFRRDRIEGEYFAAQFHGA